ncbi:MAG: hypothetical protein FWD80_04905, partial [Propionibacteriaceae bacterium]|nr:hypothetical protein [Propionibacteriaceae bacterium]
MKAAKVGIAGLAVCLLLGAIGVEASKATATPAGGPLVLLVNSADFGGPDANPGDGICDAGGTVTIDGEDVPRCTLRAAIEEANAYAAAIGATNGDEILITLDPGFAGGTIIGANTAGSFMQTTPASNLATGPVWFVVTAPMTIDLQNRLGTGGPGFTSTVFAITGSNVTVNNASSILGGDTSFVLGGAAANFTIDGGQTYQSANNFAQRFLLVNNGATGVTWRNYRVGGLQPSSTQTTDARGALVFAPNGQAKAVTGNVLVDGVDFTSPQVTAAGVPSTTCNASDGSGCVSTGVNMSTGANVNGFEMRNSSANNIKSPFNSYCRPFNAWNLSPGSLANLNLHDNTFNNNFVASSTNMQYGVIALPNGLPLGGKNAIIGNTFDNSKATTQGFGISWMPNLASTTASGLVISDNYFDGFSVASIMLYSAGLVTMERNLFGVHSASQTNTGSEVSASGGVMIANAGSTTAHTNNASTTWWPMVPTVDASCQATFRLQPTSPTPANMTQPATPVRVDVYWTSYLTAEKFIGSTTMLTGPTTVTMPLPPETIVSGATTGYIRVQTQSMGPSGMPYGQMQSSQFSGTQTI